MILAVLSQKGGCGKTTLSLHLAAHYVQHYGRRVLVVDSDPQASALDWAAVRTAAPLFPAVGLPRPVLHGDVPGLAADYDLMVIDGPPRVTDVVRSALLVADVVLIPVQPSPMDVWACQPVVQLLDEARLYRPTQQARLCINRKIPGTVLGRDVGEALGRYAVPVLTAPVCQRVAFAEALAAGQTVCETAPQGAAAREIAAVVAEMEALYG